MLAANPPIPLLLCERHLDTSKEAEEEVEEESLIQAIRCGGVPRALVHGLISVKLPANLSICWLLGGRELVLEPFVPPQQPQWQPQPPLTPAI